MAQSKREYHRVYQPVWVKKNPIKPLLYSAKHRAKRANIEFSLVGSDIVIPEVCPILGVPLEKGGRHAPSLDRKDNTRGYTPDNVWVVSRQANVMKNDATPEELEKFSEWINQLRR